MMWTAEAAVRCNQIDNVYISTDSELIREVVKNYVDKRDVPKLAVVDRAPHTATDDASTESVMLDFANRVDFDIIVLIQATSPLTQTRHLEEALERYLASGFDSLVSVVRQKRFILREDGGLVIPQNYDPMERPRRQDWDGFLVENGAFYITSREALLKSGNRMSGKLGCYEMPEETYYELDEPSDWLVIETLLEQRKKDGTLSRFIERGQKVRMFVSDCDGVLTDGGMYYSESGDEIKRFNTIDGMGFELLRNAGFVTAIVTGENSIAVKRRADKLRVNHLYMGVKDKRAVVDDVRKQHWIDWSEIAFVGDDINDLEVMNAVGLPIAVANAQPCVKDVACYVTSKSGGQGAVREAINLLLEVCHEGS